MWITECKVMYVVEATGRNAMQMRINSDMTATRITSDLAIPFSITAMDQSSMVDYEGVTNTVRPVWTLRFSTID